MTKPNQIETLPGIVAPTEIAELSRPRGLVTATRPAYWDLSTGQYDDLTPAMLDAATPGNLRPDLIGASRQTGSFCVDYELDNGARQTVTLNADEYRTIQRPYSPGYLADTVDSSVRAGKYSLLPREALAAKSNGMQANALKKKYEAMGQRLGGLTVEHTLLTRLEEASTQYWRQRGHTDRLRVEIGNVIDIMIPNVLTVVGHQRNWSDEEAELMRRSIEYRLFFTTPEKQRMVQWQGLTGLLRDYDQHKITAFKDRMGRIKGYLRKIAPELELATLSE